MMENLSRFKMKGLVELPRGFFGPGECSITIEELGRSRAMPDPDLPLEESLGDGSGGDGSGSGVNHPQEEEPRMVRVDREVLEGLERAQLETDFLYADDDEAEDIKGLDYLTLLLDEPKTIPIEAIFGTVGHAAEQRRNTSSTEPEMVASDPLTPPLSPTPRSAPVEPPLDMNSWVEAELIATAQLREWQAISAAPSLSEVAYDILHADAGAEPIPPISAQELRDNLMLNQIEVSYMEALAQVQMRRRSEHQMQEPRRIPAAVDELYGNMHMEHADPQFPDPYMDPWGEVGMGIRDPLRDARNMLEENRPNAYPLADGVDAAKMKRGSGSPPSTNRLLQEAALGFGRAADAHDLDAIMNNSKERHYLKLLDELLLASALFFLLILPTAISLCFLHQSLVAAAKSGAVDGLSQATGISPSLNISNNPPQIQSSVQSSGGGSMPDPSPKTDIDTDSLRLPIEQFNADREVSKKLTASQIWPVNPGSQGEKDWHHFSFVWETREVLLLARSQQPKQCPEDLDSELIDENGPTKFLHHPLRSVNYQEGQKKNLDIPEAGSACTSRRCGLESEKAGVHRRQLQEYPLKMVTSRTGTQAPPTDQFSDELSLRATVNVDFNQRNESTDSQHKSSDLLLQRTLRSPPWDVHVIVVRKNENVHMDIELEATFPSTDSLESLCFPKVSVKVETIDKKRLQLEVVVLVF